MNEFENGSEEARINLMQKAKVFAGEYAEVQKMQEQKFAPDELNFFKDLSDMAGEYIDTESVDSLDLEKMVATLRFAYREAAIANRGVPSHYVSFLEDLFEEKGYKLQKVREAMIAPPKITSAEIVDKLRGGLS